MGFCLAYGSNTSRHFPYRRFTPGESGPYFSGDPTKSNNEPQSNNIYVQGKKPNRSTATKPFAKRCTCEHHISGDSLLNLHPNRRFQQTMTTADTRGSNVYHAAIVRLN